jgi:hypothetical protein
VLGELAGVGRRFISDLEQSKPTLRLDAVNKVVEGCLSGLHLAAIRSFVRWPGNGDMHLKNFSLLTDANRFTRLTPAYDLVCTRLMIPDECWIASALHSRDQSS